MATPFWFVAITIIAYAIAYWGYGKWFDRTIWKPDPNRTTPAHMYTDGVEYFPVSRYVLWGYQFKSVAALGPILGPFIAIQFGWAPALAWIIIGNFFIGWVQDYSSVMVSVRNQGRSFGPITYEFTGNAGRSTLLGFILFYLIIISATFIFLIARFWNIFPGAFAATLGIIITGVIAGQLIYKARMNIGAVTLISLVLMVVALWLGTVIPITLPFGAWNILAWALICSAFLWLASILPLPTLIQPVNFISFFPTFLAVVFILVGALLSPATGVALAQPAWKGFMGTANQPLWPILFVAIACGAISGWHSLVGSSTTSKQLDIETDAHPVGAGAMLTEGLLALASLTAYMVLSPAKITELQANNVASWVFGAKTLTPFLTSSLGDAFMTVYFATTLVLYAITVQALVTRFWRLVSAEVFGSSILSQKHVSTAVGLLIPVVLAVTGSWNNIWLYFGGANQLLAGLALMLITIHLARVKAPTIYTAVPALFMIVTTLAALAWQVRIFWIAATSGKTLVLDPLKSWSPALASTLDWVSVGIGLALFLLGLRMALLTWKAYSQATSGGAATPTPVAGDD